MELQQRILVCRLLMQEFARLAEEVDPYNDNLLEITKRTLSLKIKMQMFYKKHGEPPELLEQMEQIDSIYDCLVQKYERR